MKNRSGKTLPKQSHAETISALGVLHDLRALERVAELMPELSAAIAQKIRELQTCPPPEPDCTLGPWEPPQKKGPQ